MFQQMEAALDEYENEAMIAEDDWSDEDFEVEASIDGRGSKPGRKNCKRDFDQANDQLTRDYFCENPTYTTE